MALICTYYRAEPCCKVHLAAALTQTFLHLQMLLHVSCCLLLACFYDLCLCSAFQDLHLLHALAGGKLPALQSRGLNP